MTFNDDTVENVKIRGVHTIFGKDCIFFRIFEKGDGEEKEFEKSSLV